MPDKVQAWVDRAAETKDWPHVCLKCREIALRRAAPDVADEPEPEAVTPSVEERAIT
jgi:hypothetical protein